MREKEYLVYPMIASDTVQSARGWSNSITLPLPLSPPSATSADRRQIFFYFSTSKSVYFASILFVIFYPFLMNIIYVVFTPAIAMLPSFFDRWVIDYIRNYKARDVGNFGGGGAFRRVIFIVTAIGARLLIKGTPQQMLNVGGQQQNFCIGVLFMLQKFLFTDIDAT